jgi:ABC-type branched-subunit amino acid transport system substrate-binding protein
MFELKYRNAMGMVKIAIAVLIVVFLVSSSFIIYSPRNNGESLRIGVLLPLTGPDAMQSDEVLNWAVNNINMGGGIDNHKIELVYKDSYTKDVKELAQEFIRDSSIKIVIGPGSSADVYRVAPMFIKNKKILISPFSTAGDVFRAFSGNRYFWRTVQGDVAQIRTILHELSLRNVTKASLLCEDSTYGKTFSDWAGFFSLELGIELLNVVKFEAGSKNTSEAINQALEGNPEYIITAAFPGDAVNIKRELDKSGSQAKLFFTDAAESPYVIDELGEAADGLEGATPAADASNGFETAYKSEFGYYPWDYASTTYDALLISIYTLARQEYSKGQEEIADSIEKIVSGSGVRVNWSGASRAISMILNGELPNVTGAAGSLNYDKEFGVDPLETHYSLWRVEERDSFRDFWTVKRVNSSKSLDVGTIGDDVSAYRTQASIKHKELADKENTSYVPGKRNDSWAVVIATTMGWENYRHQSDALAIYDHLKKNGMSDDKIILFLTDDVQRDEKNPIKGNVHHAVGGKNLRENASIDYSGSNVTVQNFRNALLGIKSNEAPIVLETDTSSDIFLYIVGHGAKGSIRFDTGGSLNAVTLNATIEEMYKNNRYRQIFVVIETCFSESMTVGIRTPGVVVLTASSISESSLSTNYDSEINMWLADDFTYQFLIIISKGQNITILELYAAIYERVAGSHVRLKNYDKFGGISTVLVSEFVSP